jgi:hypothetical protein
MGRTFWNTPLLSFAVEPRFRVRPDSRKRGSIAKANQWVTSRFRNVRKTKEFLNYCKGIRRFSNSIWRPIYLLVLR